ncbi:hypothetical protein CIB48_g5884 [Xylaria polymorpha]|nr:hypothetical protein CIB48_g5884 [Xylaria polymorpha]
MVEQATAALVTITITLTGLGPSPEHRASGASSVLFAICLYSCAVLFMHTDVPAVDRRDSGLVASTATIRMARQGIDKAIARSSFTHRRHLTPLAEPTTINEGNSSA